MLRPSSTARALPIAYVVLRILIVLNWIYGAIVLAILVGMFAAEQWTMTALGLPLSAQSGPLIMGMRAIAAFGVVAVPLNLAMLNRLVAMVETVRAGDPFIAINAYRLQAVAWFLFGQQLLSVVIGLIGKSGFDPRTSASSRRRLFTRRLARGDPDLRSRPHLRRGHLDARRPQGDGLTWQSQSNLTTCFTTGG